MLRRIDLAGPPWPLHDAAATRDIEQRALAGVAPGSLMRRAGAAVAKLALALNPQAQRVSVVAGPGNNGGDGLEAAAILQASHRRVTVHLLADPRRQGPDARAALQRARDAGVTLVDGPPAEPPSTDLAIDALLGIGLARAPDGAIAQAIATINAVEAPRLAVDLPSGLDADRGTAPGPAVQATHTLAMLTLKPGLFTARGRDHAGEVWLADLGVAADRPPTAWLAAALAALDTASRPHAAHKGSFGDAAVIGGAPGMVGAAWLAAAAALAAGAGRVFVSLLDPAAEGAPPMRPELMPRPALWRDGHAMLRSCTVVCGCGGGAAVAQALPPVLSLAPRLVLDADALNAVAADEALRRQVAARRGRATVLTPHPLEAARLLGLSSTQVQADRFGSAQALADGLGAVVVLKGSGSIVAAPGLPPWVNRSGNAALASAGTGDVLAGWIGGAMAAAADDGTSDAEAWRRGCAAVVARHGLAADHHGARSPLRAADLIERMLDLG
jgi:hydroxyethylthiazole kinase-like uncharacterized protein yjeF